MSAHSPAALVPSFTAFSVVNLLKRHFPNLVDYEFTAQMEVDLDGIAEGTGEAIPWLHKFYFGDDNDPGLKEKVDNRLGEIDANKRREEEERFFESIGSAPEFRVAVERMWPTLTPEQFLHDLYGAPALLRLAAKDLLADDERDLLERPRSADIADAPWTTSDLPLLDEAAELLGSIAGPRRRSRAVREDTQWMIEDTVDDISLQTGELDTLMRRELIRRLTDAERATDNAEDDEPIVFGYNQPDSGRKLGFSLLLGESQLRASDEV